MTLNYTYDPFGNLNTLKSSDETLFHSFAYTPSGKLLSMKDELSKLTVNRKIDPQGNVLLEEFSNGTSVAKNYDQLNRLVSLSLSDGGSIRYEYDPLFLRSVKRFSSTENCLYEHKYEAYDFSGLVTSERMIGNLDCITYERDTKGQLTKISGNFFEQECQYDEVGNLKYQKVNGSDESFLYDDLSQLTSESGHSYAYDSLFNRLLEDDSECGYNSLNESTSIDEPRFVYDLRGNVIKKTISGQKQTFAYDPLNRLIESTKGNHKVCFAYDPLGRKISETIYEKEDAEWKQNQQNFILYHGWNDIGTISKKGKLKSLRVLGNGIHSKQPSTVAIEVEGNPYAAIQDYQGNIKGLIDISTKVHAASYDYSAFGKQMCVNDQLENPWQYATKRFYPKLQLSDFGKRHYDLMMARWLTTDPAGFANSYNLYQYNFNNPFRYTDPDGQFAFVIPIIGLAFGLGTASLAVITTEVVTYALMASAAAWGVNELFKAKRAFDAAPYKPIVFNETTTTTEVPPFTYDDVGDNPEICPGEGFEWKGSGTPASGKGRWVRGKRPDFETLHPDLTHPQHGPHWDYVSPQFPGGVRLYPNGSWELKKPQI